MKDISDPLPERRIEDLLLRTEGHTSLEECALLYDLARKVRGGCIVEVGSYRGRSTVALGCGSLDGSKVPVFAIEPHEVFVGVLGGHFGPADRGAFYKAMLESGAYQIVRLINLSSEQVVGAWHLEVALLWIDGDHRYESVRRDIDSWWPHLRKGSLIAFDDALDPAIGPYQVVGELLATGECEKVREFGKLTVLQLVQHRAARQSSSHQE